MLDVRGITKRFGGLVAVDDVSFRVAPRSIHSVIGPNGAGKTTLFNVLTGVYVPEAGEVTLDGTRISGRKPEQIAARGVGRTFQNIRLFASMTVLENVVVGGSLHTRYNYVDALFRTPRFHRGERDACDRAIRRFRQRTQRLDRDQPLDSLRTGRRDHAGDAGPHRMAEQGETLPAQRIGDVEDGVDRADEGIVAARRQMCAATVAGLVDGNDVEAGQVPQQRDEAGRIVQPAMQGQHLRCAGLAPAQSGDAAERNVDRKFAHHDHPSSPRASAASADACASPALRQGM